MFIDGVVYYLLVLFIKRKYTQDKNVCQWPALISFNQTHKECHSLIHNASFDTLKARIGQLFFPQWRFECLIDGVVYYLLVLFIKRKYTQDKNVCQWPALISFNQTHKECHSLIHNASFDTLKARIGQLFFPQWRFECPSLFMK